MFCVRDNGLGIDPKHHDQVFKMFKRLQARDVFGGGSGAGLTIVEKLAERRHGPTWIEQAVLPGMPRPSP